MSEVIRKGDTPGDVVQKLVAGAGGGAAISAAGSSASSGTVVFSNSNNVSFGMNGSTITASAAAGAGMAISAGTQSVNTGTVIFSNANGFTFGMAGSQTITGSYTVPSVTQFLTTAMASNRGSDFVQATAGFNGTNCSGTVASNAVSVSVGNYITTARASTDAIGLNTALTAGPLAWTVNSAGLSLNAGSAAGTTSGFAGANISMSLTHNTAGLNISASVAAPGGGAAATLSGTNPFADKIYVAAAWQQASLFINQIDLPCAIQFDMLGLRISHSNATNSSGSCTISAWVGVSSRNVSTLSSVASTSFTTAITQSGTVGSYSRYGGVKWLPIPWTTTLTARNYWVGIVVRSTTGGANMTLGQFVGSMVNSTASGYFGSASAATAGVGIGVGVYSATTAGMPTAISLTQINGNSSAFARQPVFQLMSSIF